MIITIEDKSFDTAKITQLYPAAMVKTGYEDETTPMSLEWLDVEAKDKVEIDGFAIFLHLGEEEKHSFFYESREALDKEIGKLSAQLQHI
jgi:hypothetical protein